MNRSILEKAIELRHELHMHPEVSEQEIETKERLINFVTKETNLKVVDCGKWFYAYYASEAKETEKKTTIGFRADFDALPIDEKNDLPYCSKIEGVSHRCGHDGHAATLAALACEISESGADRDVYFIFQHAEEIGTGAKVCAELIKEKDIERIYAYHNWSGFPEKSVVLRKGTVMCASKGLTIKFTGKPAHASQPEDGKNPALAIAELIKSVDEIQKEKIYGGLVLATIVGVTVGEKNFGISAEKGEINLTLRGLLEKDMLTMEGKILEVAKKQAKLWGLEMVTEENDVFPETFNDEAVVEQVERVAKATGYQVLEMKDPIRSSEDFGYFQKKCPGIMMHIGNGEDYPQIHTEPYNFNDNIIEAAVDLFKAIIAD